MANLTTRPVLNGNDLNLLLSGLELLDQQYQESARHLAKTGEFELAGYDLSIVNDIAEMQDRLRGLLTSIWDEAMGELAADYDDESLPTVTDMTDIPLPDEVGTIPVFTEL